MSKVKTPYGARGRDVDGIPINNNLRDRFLCAVQDSYKRYVYHGPRSNNKIKSLHGWVMKELRTKLGPGYEVSGLSDTSSSEEKVHGKYYDKKVDVAIFRDGIALGVVSIKFVVTNFKQNKNNYFEQQLGETANLRSQNIVFGHIMVLLEPILYLNKAGKVTRREHVDDETINRYGNLAQDHDLPHVPDVQCMAVFVLNEETKEVVRICEHSDLKNVSSKAYQLLVGKLGIDRFFEGIESAVSAKYAQKRS